MHYFMTNLSLLCLLPLQDNLQDVKVPARAYAERLREQMLPCVSHPLHATAPEDNPLVFSGVDCRCLNVLHTKVHTVVCSDWSYSYVESALAEG